MQWGDQKLSDLNQMMTYRATASSLETTKLSLKAAKASLQESKRGLEQNDKVKRLTQLAFVFIPFSFTTGLFGMNATVLGQGSVKIWQVVVGAVIVYMLVAIL